MSCRIMNQYLPEKEIYKSHLKDNEGTKLLYTGSIPRSVFMHFLHENHEFYRRQNQFIDFVCINCYWNEVRVNSNGTKKV